MKYLQLKQANNNDLIDINKKYIISIATHFGGTKETVIKAQDCLHFVVSCDICTVRKYINNKLTQDEPLEIVSQWK